MFFFSPEWAGASDELQVMPIAFKTEMTSQDYSDWYNFEFEYCNQVSTLANIASDRHVVFPYLYVIVVPDCALPALPDLLQNVLDRFVWSLHL